MASLRGRAAAGCWIGIVIISLSAATGCGDVNAALEHLLEARRLSADLLVQFTKAADAANRAVMSDTDEASVASAREAEQATQAVQKDIDALGAVLEGLGYADEAGLLKQFVGRFTEYRELDRRILDLAVQNTNLKAQRLTFGAAQEAADAFLNSLDPVTSSAPAKDAWRAKALVAAAVAAVREIQVVQAPHIAAADDAVMARMEGRIATSEAAARSALETLATFLPSAVRPHLAAATTALDQFMGLNTQIIALSRLNTNVRSLALSLDQKRKLTTACEDSLHALRDALAKRGYTGDRYK